jgi:hypothetical protein
VIQCSPTMCKALGLIPSTEKNKLTNLKIKNKNIKVKRILFVVNFRISSIILNEMLKYYFYKIILVFKSYANI